MQLKDYTQENVKPFIRKRYGLNIKGEVRLSNAKGHVIYSQRFASTYGRKKITDNYIKQHSNKIDIGEWYLSYLLD